MLGLALACGAYAAPHHAPPGAAAYRPGARHRARTPAARTGRTRPDHHKTG